MQFQWLIFIGDLQIIVSGQGDGRRGKGEMVIKVLKFKTWEELYKESERLSKLGYICEVKGWDDMRNNRLTVSSKD